MIALPFVLYEFQGKGFLKQGKGTKSRRKRRANLALEHTGTVELETERLLLRRFDLDDAESMLVNWIANPKVQNNYGEPIYESIGAVRDLLNLWIPQYASRSFYRWAITLKETGENIGQIAFCGVYEDVETAEVEYCIGEAYWRNGYATEALEAVLRYAFEPPKFYKLEAFHRAENPSSGRVLHKAGMERVPNVYRCEIENKLPLGKMCYALTRDEYFASMRLYPDVLLARGSEWVHEGEPTSIPQFPCGSVGPPEADWPGCS